MTRAATLHRETHIQGDTKPDGTIRIPSVAIFSTRMPPVSEGI